MQRIDHLQLLRGLAAIAVVAFHAAGAASVYSQSPAFSAGLLGFGYLGVDLFFVISGFVMYVTSKNVSSGEFIRKRLHRIVPLYWVLTGVAMLAMVGMGKPFEAQKLAASLSFLSFFKWDMPVVYVGWSLEFEMLFYGCVAASLLLVKRPWPLTCAILGMAVVVGAVAQATFPGAKFLTNPIMLEFLMGVVVAQACTERRVGLIEAGALVLAATAAHWFGSEIRFFWGLPSAALVAGAVFLRHRRLPRWMVASGDGSYSIYLIQFFTISATAKVLQRLAPQLNGDVFILFTTTVTVVIGMACFYLVETPMSRWLRSRQRRIPAPVIA